MDRREHLNRHGVERSLVGADDLIRRHEAILGGADEPGGAALLDIAPGLQEPVRARFRPECRPLPGDDRTAQLERRGDHAQRLDRGAGAADHDRAVVEQPLPEALRHVDGLDLGYVYLDRVAIDETALVDHATVREHDLGAEPMPRRCEPEQ